MWSRRALFGTAAAAGTAVGIGVFARYAGDAAPPPASTSPNPSDAATGPATVRAQTARGTVVVEPVATGVVRVQVLDPDAPTQLTSYAVQPGSARPEATVEHAADAVILSTPELTVAVNPDSGAITATNGAGVAFLHESANGYTTVDEGCRWQIELPREESCHGLGQRAFPLSLRDRKLGLWNYDARSYKPGADPLYLSVPFYLGHRPDVSYGIFWDNPARGSIDIDSDNSELLTFESVRRPLDLYLISGDGPQQVVQRFAALTGHMEMVPLWALGYHQSRWGYRNEAQFRAVAATMREQRIPCDVLHFDIDYMSGFRVFTWDSTRFPSPKRLLSDLKKDGFQAVAILDPGVKVDPSYNVYAEGKERNLFLATADGGRLIREVWPGDAEFPDFTNPDCRTWWAGHAAEFCSAGFGGLWNDMNEPSTFTDSRTIPDDTPHDWEGQGATHVGGGHAVFGMQMARASREGLASLNQDKRPFVISRAGYAGLQRFATTWNGDSLATWAHLQITIPQLLNLGISGIPFSGSDAGGFRGDPDSELYLRWMQLASMTPFFRTHSARTAKDRNPWSYDTQTTDRIREVVERRYRLLPYFYTQLQRACADGVPIVRPMFFERPDSAEYAHIDDQFMLGDHLLVAPIIEEGARSRTVELPPGSWYRFDNAGAALDGDRGLTDSAGLGLPLYVRAGAVVPTWPVRQSTSERVERLLLQVYAGSAKSRLYEDAGDGYGYRDGERLVSTFTTTLDGNRLTITRAQEGDFAVPYRRVEVQVGGFGPRLTSVRQDGKSTTWSANTGVLTISTEGFETLELIR